MSRKKLTDKDVINIFDTLLKNNKTTTSLDVKKELRKDGFFATQTEVTDVIRDYAASNMIDFDYNGTYRTYKLKGANIPSVAPSQTKSSSSLYDLLDDDDNDNGNDSIITSSKAGTGLSYGKDGLTVKTDNTNKIQINGSKIKKKKLTPASPSDRIPISKPGTGDWQIKHKDANGLLSSSVYFSKKLTRSQAKYAYKKLKGVDFLSVRTKRIK